MMTLSEDFERMLLFAVTQGYLPAVGIRQEELSKNGRYVLNAFKALSKTSDPPFTMKDLFVTSTDVLGGNRDDLRAYLRDMAKVKKSSPKTGDLLRAIRTKQQLIRLINQAGEQLGSGIYDKQKLLDIMAETESKSKLSSLREKVKDNPISLPEGPEVKSLAPLSEAAGGFFGLWVVGGEPGIGKSTIVLQMALSLQKTIPVLYYDLEQGEEVVLSHIEISLNHDMEKVKRATEKLYIRDSLKTLNDDIQETGCPSVIIVDPIQKAPTSAEYRRQGIDTWITRFEQLKKKGHLVILISQMGRGEYNESRSKYGRQANLGGFKETGELEYTADVAIQLLWEHERGGNIELHIVKNRHRPTKGYLCTLERKNDWRFKVSC